MLFIGLDLAWGGKNTTGGVALVQNGDAPATVADVRETLTDDADILRWVDTWDKKAGQDGLLIGIDAPLLVPNLTGKRPCETELGKRFAKRQAGAHPANRTLFKNDVRGEHLVNVLAERGVVHSPYLDSAKQRGVRQVCEVFPHPAHVVLFHLPRTLKYKAKPGRTAESRAAAFAEYARLLRSLPLVSLPADWPPADAAHLKGAALKQLEDGLDALTCAYVVLYCWAHGPEGVDVIGDMTQGYIVVPRALPAFKE